LPVANEADEIVDGVNRLEMGDRKFRRFDLLEIEREENEVERIDAEIPLQVVAPQDAFGRRAEATREELTHHRFR
jgi:hypothetical protein